MRHIILLCNAGLQKAYYSRTGAYHYMRKLMALPFLPAEHIQQTFEDLRQQAANNERLRELTDYMQTTWMESSIWSIAEWCVFMQTVRTNNDVEGWHNRLKQQALRGHLPFSLLVQVLKKEADLVTLQARLVSTQKLQRFQRKKYAVIQGRLFKAWEEYAAGNRTTTSLLRACAYLFQPTPSNE